MERTPYPAALRLYAIAGERWSEISAAYITIDLLRARPDLYLNCVFTWCLERIDPEKREEWIAMLEAPLPGDEKMAPTPETIEEEGASFMAFMAQAKGSAGASTG